MALGNLSGAPASTSPKNIALVLTDDLDATLGSVDHALPKMSRLIGGEGATASNWYIHTPICCPSRSELLAGRYFHNLRNPLHGQPGCMQVNTSKVYDEGYFAPSFAALGYTVGVFGKHLNNDNPRAAPPGVGRWLVNGGGAYLDPSFSYASAGTPGTQVRPPHRPTRSSRTRARRAAPVRLR
jgi:arylsulfatase A-like enzyme